jgi:hypothetical protein
MTYSQHAGSQRGGQATNSTALSAHSWSRLVAGVAVILLGADLPIAFGVSSSLVVALVLLPVWVSAVRSWKSVRVAYLAVGLCTLSALLLFVLRNNGGNFSTPGVAGFLIVFLGVSSTVGVVVWASRFNSASALMVLFAIGWLINIASRWNDADILSNPWKFGLGYPIAILVLGLTYNSRIWFQVLSVLVLAGIGLTQESRSYSGILLVVAVLLVFSRLWQRAVSKSARTRLVFAAFAVAGAAYAVYLAVTNLLLSGVFGAVIRNRTLEQMDLSGNLIAGGRPEWSATLALMQLNPWGYGPGAVPNSLDFHTAQEGLDTVNVDANNTYFTGYTFGGQFKLHSIIADFWVNFGLVGLIAACAMLGIFVWFLLREFSTGVMSAGVTFLMLSSSWFLLFGPIFTNFPQVAFSLALVFIAIRKLAQQEPQLEVDPNGVQHETVRHKTIQR